MLDSVLSFLNEDVSAKAVGPIILAFVLGVMIMAVRKRR